MRWGGGSECGDWVGEVPAAESSRVSGSQPPGKPPPVGLVAEKDDVLSFRTGQRECIVIGNDSSRCVMIFRLRPCATVVVPSKTVSYQFVITRNKRRFTW